MLSPANFSQPLNNNNNESEEQEEDRNVQFYADDGLLCGPEGPELQRALDFFATSFESLGLKMNAKKTEYMVMTGNISNVYNSNKARDRKNTGEGESFKERRTQKVTCNLCGKLGGRVSLLRHQASKSCRDKRAEYTGPPKDFDQGVLYFIQRFEEHLEDPCIHVTCATDTNNMEFVFTSNMDLVLKTCTLCR